MRDALRVLRAVWLLLLVAALALGIEGYCAYATFSCWRRGGHPVKNVFDMPECIDAKR